MGRRRGFFAELQYQAAKAQKERARQAAAAERERLRLGREMVRARLQAVRAGERAARASTQAKAQAEREAKQLHVQAQQAKADSLNADLAAELAAIDDILQSTLAVDDYVDLETLRRVAEHPPFTSNHLRPLPPPPPIAAPPEPRFVAPPPPTGLSAVFSKKKHQAAMAAARAQFEQAHAAWRAAVARIPGQQHAAAQQHQAAEAERLRRLASDRRAYDAECERRQQAVDAENARLDALINGLARNEPLAVDEYVGIVFSNSIYPDTIAKHAEFDFSFSAEFRELTVTIYFPPPDTIPTTKTFRYVRTSDEIAETKLPQRDAAARYADVVNNMALRTLHEMWESDRAGKIDSISLTGGVDHVDPATGQDIFIPLVALAVSRTDFLQIDLARITPAEAMKHLRAVVSTSPYRLTAIDDKNGIRR